MCVLRLVTWRRTSTPSGRPSSVSGGIVPAQKPPRRIVASPISGVSGRAPCPTSPRGRRCRGGLGLEEVLDGRLQLGVVRVRRRSICSRSALGCRASTCTRCATRRPASCGRPGRTRRSCGSTWVTRLRDHRGHPQPRRPGAAARARRPARRGSALVSDCAWARSGPGSVVVPVQALARPLRTRRAEVDGATLGVSRHVPTPTQRKSPAARTASRLFSASACARRALHLCCSHEALPRLVL